MFVSEYSKQQYKNLNVPSTVIEYPIEKKILIIVWHKKIKF